MERVAALVLFGIIQQVVTRSCGAGPMAPQPVLSYEGEYLLKGPVAYLPYAFGGKLKAALDSLDDPAFSRTSAMHLNCSSSW